MPSKRRAGGSEEFRSTTGNLYSKMRARNTGLELRRVGLLLYVGRSTKNLVSADYKALHKTTLQHLEQLLVT